MKATYYQNGEALDYVNKTERKIEHGEVVIMGSRIGIAGNDIIPGEKGALHVCGVYLFKKESAEEIVAGAEVFYTENGISSTVSESAEACKAGYVTEDSPANSTEVYVKINA